MKASGQEHKITGKPNKKEQENAVVRFCSVDADCTTNATEENKQSSSCGIKENALLLHP